MSGVYEGKVIWVGADQFSKDGGVRAKIDSYDEFFNVPGRFAAMFQKQAQVKVKLIAKGKKFFVENAKALGSAPPPRTAGPVPAGVGGGGKFGGGQSGGMSKEDWDKKDAMIRYQSSRKDALELVTLLLANGALPLGSGKADKKAEIILGEVDRYTGRFFREIATLGAVKRDDEQREEDPEVDEEELAVDQAVAEDEAFGDTPNDVDFDDDDDDVPF